MLLTNSPASENSNEAHLGLSPLGGGRGALQPPGPIVSLVASPHGLPVGDSHRVELQVQFGCQVEWHALGPL
jgi:hypothetical protein